MNIIISNFSQQPIYQQIVNQIKDLIMKGQLKETEALPSIRSLAKELKISVITTKRAYDELDREGFIVTVPGKGSYVAPQNMEMLREAQMKVVEEKFSEGIAAAKTVNLTLDELKEILIVLFEEV